MSHDKHMTFPVVNSISENQAWTGCQYILLIYNNTAFTLQIHFSAISSLAKTHTEHFHSGGELLTRGRLNGVHTLHKQHWRACI